ncbi:biotin transport system permease protein [Saccharopolyspora antimicrobica]|uniref:Biotin transport system permease protein n=1 Tax=Saccharopolyspora antimicrobica TaxID=455193 RepID=A0A1I5HZ72_9PSEU|nr:energy-coupling factor transporter transmembrane component T [Saccharopolyspora antimicrobica]RKT83132.1 biotin transport system permease protein [Saccharopolyspora antimicrobica]SFO53622.1 biotin transport system permease protein [Saccharopolyspora antimicrobica]
MNPLGLYEPGTSTVHRAPAGWKFLALLVFAVVIFVLNSPLALASSALAVVLAYVLARIPARRCWQISRLLIPLLAVVFLLQWWMLGLDSAAVVCLRLLTALGAANLFTLTTRVDDLVSAVERGLRPTRRLGVRPERIGLLVGLTLQAVAALSTIATQVREAQRARNAERSISAFAVPFLVRTLRHADDLGEALAARGVGDDETRT